MLIVNSLICLVPGGPPQNFSITGTSHTLNFSWFPPPSLQHNGVITDYNLTCTVGGMINSNRVNDTSFVIRVDPFTNYSCTVRAATTIGDGPATAVMSGVTDEDSECLT